MNHISSTQMQRTEGESRQQPRSFAVLFLITVIAIGLFVSLIALGTWQVHRLAWKKNLIARVDQRLAAAPVELTARELWGSISKEADEYRRVEVKGVFHNQSSIKVHASTVLGRGFWVLTPLKIEQGGFVWVNRGFVLFNAIPSADKNSLATSNLQHISGLLRISEPNGTVMNANQPDEQQWYSRDIAAMSKKGQITDVASFFIDASAAKISPKCSAGQCSDQPIGGLTVVSFNNNHLAYLITWYVLALMVTIAYTIWLCSEFKVRREHDAMYAMGAMKAMNVPGKDSS